MLYLPTGRPLWRTATSRPEVRILILFVAWCGGNCIAKKRKEKRNAASGFCFFFISGAHLAHRCLMVMLLMMGVMAKIAVMMMVEPEEHVEQASPSRIQRHSALVLVCHSSAPCCATRPTVQHLLTLKIFRTSCPLRSLLRFSKRIFGERLVLTGSSAGLSPVPCRSSMYTSMKTSSS